MGDLRVLLRSYIKETSVGKYLRRKRFDKTLGSVSGAKKAIQSFAPDTPENEMDALIKDMVRMSQNYRYQYDEYFLYNFRDKTDDERLEFVADLDRIDIVENLNKAKYQPLFDDKARTYKKYKKYYKREVCAIGRGLSDFDKLKKFLEEKKRIIIKPADSSCGQGIRILDISKIDDTDSVLREVLLNNKRGLITEEVIIQDPRMAKLHPQSVNTLRVTTIRMNDRIEILPPFLKLGRKDSVVDNGGVGGILCAFDINTGKVTHTGDEYGCRFTVHPETNEEIIGFTIPRWDEAVALVKELAMITPSNRYTGWDLALTENGWVLVEANARGQFIGWQLTTQVGFKREICKLLLEISEKKYGKLVNRLNYKNK